jgi:hypothetical protein
VIRGRIDEGSELFMRQRLRVLVESDHSHDGRRLVYAEKRDDDGGVWPGWYDPHMRPEDGGLPEDVSPFVLECQRDVAYAVYRALGEHFEGADPTPVASDRAYGDARTDIGHLHELVDKLTGALIDRPQVVAVRPGDVHTLSNDAGGRGQ